MICIKTNRASEIKGMLCNCSECIDSSDYFKNLQKLGKNLKLDKKFNSILAFLNALGNKERLFIINVLIEKERCVCELEAILDKSQPSISHHLRELERADLIRGWKKGKFTYYTLLKENLEKKLEILNQEFNIDY